MSGVPSDPFRSPWHGGQVLQDGRALHAAVTGQDHYEDALRAVNALSHEDLAKLAFYVAADAVAENGMHAWSAWWKGVDSPGEEEPTAMDATPGQLWNIVRPPEERS